MVQARIIKGEFKNLFSRQFHGSRLFFFLKNRGDRANLHVSFHASFKVERRHTPCYQRAGCVRFSVQKGDDSRTFNKLQNPHPYGSMSLEKGKYRVCELASDRI